MLLLLPLVACQSQNLQDANSTTKPGDTPSSLSIPRSGETEGKVYVLDAAKSTIDIIVRRAGPLARLGHDHVIIARELQGYFLRAPTLADARAEIRFAVSDLEVDPPAARKRHNLSTDPDADDIAATRRNMLEKVLDAGQWPYITARISDLAPAGDRYSGELSLQIHGKVTKGRESFEWEIESGVATVRGTMHMKQTEVGLEPFSALAGALRVADELEIHFELTGSERP